MAVTKASFEGEDPATGQPLAEDEQPTFNTNPDNPDEVVEPVREVPSRLVAEAKLRHEAAEQDTATPQERKQAAVEQAHALSTRPDGSYAQLHETVAPTLAVADDEAVAELRDQQEQAVEGLRGSEPANSPAGVRREEESAKARAAADQSATDRQVAAQREQAARDAAAKSGDASKGAPGK